MTRTRIKICGITNHEDAANAVAFGADALCFNFYKGSSRYISPEKAAEICALLPAFVTTVGIVVNEPIADVNRMLKGLRIDLLQFHGDETPAQCEGFHRPWLKALRVGNGEDIEAQVARYANASD